MVANTEDKVQFSKQSTSALNKYVTTWGEHMKLQLLVPKEQWPSSFNVAIYNSDLNAADAAPAGCMDVNFPDHTDDKTTSVLKFGEPEVEIESKKHFRMTKFVPKLYFVIKISSKIDFNFSCDSKKKCFE